MVLSIYSLTGISQHAPLGVIPTQFNGSFAGSAGDPRLNSNLSYSRNTYTTLGVIQASYDHFFPQLQSGIGITALQGVVFPTHEAYNNPSVTYSGYSIDIAPKISARDKSSIKAKYSFSPSISVSYQEMRQKTNAPDSSILSPERLAIARFGFLFNTSKYYFGYSIDLIRHYKNPRENKPEGVVSNFQMGYSFQKSPDSNFSFTPELVFYLVNLRPSLFPYYSFRFRHNSFLWGIHSFEILPDIQIGWQGKYWRIITYHHVLSNNRYSGHLAFRYIFNQKNGNGVIMY